MKRILSFCLFIGVLIACSGPKAPEFQTIANPKVVELSMKKTHVEAEIVMNNPNGVGIDVAGLEVDIHVNGIHIGKTTQTHEAAIPANSDFNVPLKFEFSPKQVLNLNNIGGLLSSVSNKKITLNYKGFVAVKIADKALKIPFDYDDEMELKKK